MAHFHLSGFMYMQIVGTKVFIVTSNIYLIVQKIRSKSEIFLKVTWLKQIFLVVEPDVPQKNQNTIKITLLSLYNVSWSTFWLLWLFNASFV